MSGYKRKRPYSMRNEDYGMGRRGSQVYASPRFKRSKGSSFVKGRDRTGGYYGRYGPGRQGELKFFDTTVTQPLISSLGSVVPSLTLIAQGVTESERIGRKCTARSIFFRYEINLARTDDAANPTPGDTCRILIYQDKQCNGAAATVLDILETEDINSHRNLANQQRFTVLCDKLHNINYSTLASETVGFGTQAEVTHSFKWYKKLLMPIEYSSTTGAITEIRSNNIGIIFISANGSVGCFGQQRIRFSDQG